MFRVRSSLLLLLLCCSVMAEQTAVSGVQANGSPTFAAKPDQAQPGGKAGDSAWENLEFLLGNWLEDAKRWGDTDAQRANLEWNARNQITLWGARDSYLRDYASKEWSGLLSGLYARRPTSAGARPSVPGGAQN